MTDTDAKIWIDDNVFKLDDNKRLKSILNSKGLNGALKDDKFVSIIRNTTGGRDWLKSVKPLEEQVADELKGWDLNLTDKEALDLAKKFNTRADKIKQIVSDIKTRTEKEQSQADFTAKKEQLKKDQETRKKDMEDYTSWTKAWKGDSWSDHSLPARLGLATIMKALPEISKDRYIEEGTHEYNTPEEMATAFLGGATEAAAFAPGIGKGLSFFGKQVSKKVLPTVAKYATRALQYGSAPVTQAYASNQDFTEAAPEAVKNIAINATVDNLPYKAISNVLKGNLGFAEKSIGKKLEDAATYLDIVRNAEKKAEVDKKLINDLGIDYTDVSTKRASPMSNLSSVKQELKAIESWARAHKDDPLAVRRMVERLENAGYSKEADFLRKADWIGETDKPLYSQFTIDRLSQPNMAIGVPLYKPEKYKQIVRNINAIDANALENTKIESVLDDILISKQLSKKPYIRLKAAGESAKNLTKSLLRGTSEHMIDEPDKLIERQWAAGFVPHTGTAEYEAWKQWRAKQK